MTSPTPPSLLTKDAVCSLLGVSPRCLETMVNQRDFPPPVRVGKRVYWSEQAVHRWLQLAFEPQVNWAPTPSPYGMPPVRPR